MVRSNVEMEDRMLLLFEVDSTFVGDSIIGCQVSRIDSTDRSGYAQSHMKLKVGRELILYITKLKRRKYLEPLGMFMIENRIVI